MIPRTPITAGTGLRLALAAGAVGQFLALPASLAQEVAAPQEPAADVQELQPMLITGSNIPTTDVVGLTPVTTITTVDIQRQGAITPTEVVRRLPAVVGANLSESYGNGGDGSSQINLRGIPGGTLVLINGRRVAPVAFADSVVDLNMVPTSAIERIEVLKDGASAIYGSDAIAGVVNIILKKSFEGVEVNAYVGNTTQYDAFRQNYSVVAGTATEKASFVAGANYYKANSIFSQDRSRSRVNVSARNSTYEANSSGTSNPGQFNAPNEARGLDRLYDPSTVASGSDDLSTGAEFLVTGQPITYNGQTYNPGSRFTVAADADDNPIRDFTGNGQVVRSRTFVVLNRSAIDPANPNKVYTPNDFHPTGTMPDEEVYPFDRFPFPIYTPAIRPAERYGVFANAAYKIFEEHVEFFSEAIYSNSKSESQLAPTPIVSAATIPADNYWNPFGVDITEWNYRTVELGPRVDSIEKDAFRFVGGFRGKLPDTETWNWEGAFLWSEEKGTQNLGGELSANRLGSSLADPTAAAFNPFGFQANSPDQLAAVANPLITLGKTQLWSVDGRVGGDAFDLPAGGVGVVVGGAYQEDEGESEPDAAQQSGDTVGYNSADILRGSRSISAAFGEVNIPIFSDKWNVPGFYAFNLRGAARYEYYSDFGDTTKPAVRFGWQPIDDLWQIYGSFSQSFKAPSFADLYTTEQQSFPDVRNPFTGTFDQIDTLQRGTPTLEPQESDNYLIGTEWRVKWVEGLKVALDYFRIERENIPGGSAQYIVDQNYRTGGSTSGTTQGQFSELITFDPNKNAYTQVVVPTLNISSDKLEGFDIRATYDLRTDAFGTFTFDMAWQYLLTYEQVQTPGSAAVDRLGDYSADEFGYESLPRLKGYGSFFWTYGDFSTGFYANYTGSYQDDNALLVPDTIDEPREVDDYLTFDIQAAYNFPYNIRLTVGCLNVTDEPPPLVVASFADQYDRGLNDLRQRFWYVSLGVKF